MFIAYRYKLIPTTIQSHLLNQWEGTTRWLWNQFLDRNIKQYATDKKFVWVHELKRSIPNIKQQYDWVKQVPAHALQNVAFDMDKALKRATKTRDQGFPKFKCKGRNHGALKIDQVGTHIKISDTHITIPKLGEVKWKYHRPITGEIKQISITKDIDSWFVSVICKVDDVTPKLIDKQKVVGIDLGISSFAILDDGVKIESPTFLKKKLKYLKKYQRRSSKKVKGSNNRLKSNIRVAKIHQKIRNQRSNWLHQTSNKLTNKYDLICLEDLKIKSLVKGKRQRSLNRAISDQGWGIFVNQLMYKAERKGHHVTKIDQWAPSSKTCHCCGHVMGKMALDIRNWICPSCGAAHDRDTNAALNIKFWGIMATDIALFEHNSNNTPGTGEIEACGDIITQECQAIDWHLEVSLMQEAACPLGPQ